jgi:hypothetical protein
MSRWDWSAIYWYGFWLGFAFAVPELTAVFWKGCPIETLSSTTKGLENRWIWVALLILIGLQVLDIHIVGSFLPKLYRTITG